MKRQLEQLRNWGAVLLLALTTPMLASAGSSTGFSPIITVDTTGQPPPDLAVENVWFTPASVSIGGAVNVSFRVRNLSGRTAESPVARVRLSSGAALTESDPGLLPLDVTLPNLIAGTAHDYSGSFNTVPGSLLPGSYSVGVRVDPLNQLGQQNTANDVAVSVARLSVTGTGGPSLVVLPATRTVTKEASSTGFNIYNAGGGTMPWTASVNGAPWLHLSSGSSAGTGSKAITVTCDANALTSPRVGTIEVSAPGATPSIVQVTVTQSGAAIPQPPVTTFQFSDISSPKNVNTAFAVTIQAMNGAALQTGFNGEVQLIAESGGNVSLRTVRFTNGSWTGNLSLDTVTTQTRIIASTTDGNHTQGQSNPFQVQGALSGVTVTIEAVQNGDVPVPGAAITLNDGILPLQGTTDMNGLVVFQVSGSRIFAITAQKSGYLDGITAVSVSGKSVFKTVELQRIGQPVILVPGMMGSCSEAKRYLWPVLPEGYGTSPSLLKLFPPEGARTFLTDVGWSDLTTLLQASGFAVFEAPWDWRMPVIRPGSDGKVAWKEYLKPVIEFAIAQTGVSKVDIVAHSTGGLMTRAYIQSQEYAGNIDRFAMVATPNEGAANAYYLWFGGDSRADFVYLPILRFNYMEWTGNYWDFLSPSERKNYIQSKIPSLEELLPVYPVLVYSDKPPVAYPGVGENPLYRLNHEPLGELTGKILTKVFYSMSEDTISQIHLKSGSSGGVYPHGTPQDYAEGKRNGDGTVLGTSARMEQESSPFPQFADASGGKHMQLVGHFRFDVLSFLTQNRPLLRPFLAKGSSLAPILNTNQLLIAVGGRSAPWITDPASAGAGISPLDNTYSNAWAQSVVSINGESSSFLRNDPPLGGYSVRLETYPGETIEISVASSVGSQTIMEQLQWIGSTNEINFTVQLAGGVSNGLALMTELPAPQNLWSFASDGSCALTWDVLTNSNVAGYRIYGRRQDESLFALLGTVASPPFSPGHSWATNASETNWFYAVVAVSINGTESPYENTVMNYVPTLAKFSSDLVSGTPPLSVAFADQSIGGVTNWSWDFNSDGIADSSEQNPVASFSQPGTYTVTLTVSGPNGEDTQVSVGHIEVVLPSLTAIRLLTDQTVELKLSGQPGRSYDIQVSTDLAAWAYFTNIVPTEPVATFVDPAAANSGARFYRVVLP